SPTLYGKASDGLAAKAMRQNFDKISAGKTSLTIGLEDEVGILESSHRGEAFFNALNLYDNVILRAMFIGNLIMGDASATGSYNQSSTQMDTTLNILNGIHEDVAAGFQVLINQIVEWNFGVNANAPNIKFESFIGKDYLALLGALQPYAQNMLVDTTSPWFEELIATTVQEQSGIKVDRDTVTEDDDEADVDYAMTENIPGTDEANNLINQIL
uniref:phage portal protein family protein n=1 Tax=uncultured Methanobrevibacter sp. TaxID=253161 RepID=UPI0025CEF00F